MKYIFISDLHLSPDTKEANTLFYNLLNQWKNNIDALYILGDFFDYWLGDDDSNEFIEEMKTKLNQFTQQTPIYFIVGNHDFTIGKRFCRETGVKLIQDCTVLKTAKHNILLSHGDVFCTLDVGYQKMKKILRNRLLLFILLRLPIAWRYKIKQKIENKSGAVSHIKSREIYNVVDMTVAEYCIKYATDIVIHGHTHNPGKYTIDVDALDTNIATQNSNFNTPSKILRVEIPDWSDHKIGGYVLLDGDNITLQMP